MHENNVGVLANREFRKTRPKEWENTLKVNVLSHFYFTKLSIPLLKKAKQDQ